MKRLSLDKIVDVSDVWIAFPSGVEGILPNWEDIPQEFKDGNSWTRLAQMMFSTNCMIKCKPRENVNAEKVLRMMKGLLRTFDCKHEHKIAGVGYILYSYYDSFEVEADHYAKT